MKRGRVTVAIIAALACAGCDNREDSAAAPGSESAVLETRMERLTASLGDAKPGASQDEPIARWLLPASLAELSGLALTPDGRLFAHNDEVARITEIDYRRGTVIKQFFVGQLRGDFEGLTCAGDRFYLLSSDGTLYEFREGADGERVAYAEHKTGLGKECEFEGVAYDAKADALVLACKNARAKHRGNLVLYRYRLGGNGEEPSELTVPHSEVIGKNNWKQLRPTDITVDPSNGNYVLVAAQEKALVEVTPAGGVVLSRPLGARHPQSEAVAITKDHILIVGDESNRTAATITLYRWQ